MINEFIIVKDLILFESLIICFINLGTHYHNYEPCN